MARNLPLIPSGEGREHKKSDAEADNHNEKEAGKCKAKVAITKRIKCRKKQQPRKRKKQQKSARSKETEKVGGKPRNKESESIERVEKWQAGR